MQKHQNNVLSIETVEGKAICAKVKYARRTTVKFSAILMLFNGQLVPSHQNYGRNVSGIEEEN